MDYFTVQIPRGECEQLLTFLRRARGYCLNARTAEFTPEALKEEPTAFYSGACGYSRATMGMVIDTLERYLPLD